MIRRLWGMGGPAGRPTIYHNNITPVSCQHHIFKTFKQHLNISHTTKSHRYHIGVASISKQFHDNIITITKHTSKQHLDNSHQYHNVITSMLHQFHINVTTISHHTSNKHIDISQQYWIPQRYHISNTSIVNPCHNNITTISHHTSIYQLNNLKSSQ